MKALGLLLVVVGLLSLHYGGISWIRRISFPTVIGWLALVGGVVLLASR